MVVLRRIARASSAPEVAAPHSESTLAGRAVREARRQWREVGGGAGQGGEQGKRAVARAVRTRCRPRAPRHSRGRPSLDGRKTLHLQRRQPIDRHAELHD